MKVATESPANPRETMLAKIGRLFNPLQAIAKLASDLFQLGSKEKVADKGDQ